MPNKINKIKKSFYIHVKVIVGARRESFIKKSVDHFEIYVKEKAERNMANICVLKLVASHFEIPINKVRIINGHRHPSKLLVVER